MINVAALTALASSAEGRGLILTHMAVTESAAVLVLDEVLKDLRSGDQRLYWMAQKHREDEVHHASMVVSRLAELGLSPKTADGEASFARLWNLYTTLNPVTVAEKYLLIQVVEEQDVPLFEVVAEAMRPHDPVTAGIFDRMCRDEKAHVRYCAVIQRELGDADSAAKLALYRLAAETFHGHGLTQKPEVEVYKAAQHFAMIEAWGSPLDPASLGSGLVIPGLCCGFVDGIGQTRTAYFYGLRANPAVPMVARGKAILRLAPRIIQAARDSGFTAAVTSTANGVVQRFWVEKLGFARNGESVLTGAL